MRRRRQGGRRGIENKELGKKIHDKELVEKRVQGARREVKSN